MSTWQLQDAKQRFSEVVRAAEAGEPQLITRHGAKVAVVIDYEGYRDLVGSKPDLKRLLESIPLPDDFEAPARVTEPWREQVAL